MANDDPRIAPLVDLLRQRGAMTAAELATALGTSQPSISRALRGAEPQVARIGRARRARYAARRDVRGLGTTWPLFRIDAQGRPEAFGDLTALYGGGSLVEARPSPDWFQGEFVDGVFPGIPWFLDDQRPQGFLGRQFAQQWAKDLGLPADILRWSDDAVLAALVLHGDDGPGNFVVGADGLDRALQQPPPTLGDDARSAAYGQLAESAMAGEPVGSSAAGEQPKFTTRVAGADGSVRHVIVKFSEPVSNPTGRRWADLLVCEHLAGELLAEQGHASARNELIWSNERLCLEVTRFDRIGAHGRRGFVTLAAWSDAHDGERDDWARATARMHESGWVDAAGEAEVRQRWWFGRMIANADMHFGNLGFFLDDRLPLAVAPSYDMLPMLYRPAANGALPPRTFEPPTPTPADQAYWQRAAEWGEAFWRRVARHEAISDAFRGMAQANGDAIAAVRQRFDISR
ncbi:type II toxin-antitoxin system HipA family toxin YjjJ [Luteibacter pinisoli]|uniref:Type II toxin-antitoxin system HipA family toxin YjjJ n=2 Tax=Luteibacter pinisoli TaxID=2589080 RepID=A0A4Y5Z770_9GAMM|nr:type II toxin-antitoxin system HipA family toxin YjjJ [Luteibacter pinisoli]